MSLYLDGADPEVYARAVALLHAALDDLKLDEVSMEMKMVDEPDKTGVALRSVPSGRVTYSFSGRPK